MPFLPLVPLNSKQNKATWKAFLKISLTVHEIKNWAKVEPKLYFSIHLHWGSHTVCQMMLLYYFLLPQSLPPSGSLRHHLPSTSMLTTAYLSFALRLVQKHVLWKLNRLHRIWSNNSVCAELVTWSQQEYPCFLGDGAREGEAGSFHSLTHKWRSTLNSMH